MTAPISSPTASLDACALRLRQYGLRPTRARLQVLQMVESSATGLLNAEEMFDALLRADANISHSTVYRATMHLVKAGLLVRSLGPDRKFYYRGTADGVVRPHVTLRCPRTGRVAVLADEVLYNRLLAVAHAHGIDVSGQGLWLVADAGAA